MIDTFARRMALGAIILALLIVGYAAATQFQAGDTLPATWLNKAYYADGGHIHDDQDNDGHAPKIDGRWHVSWGVPAAKNPAGVAYELQCTPAATGTSKCLATIDEDQLPDDWDASTYANDSGNPIGRYVNGGPEFAYLRSATLTPQVCATCQIVNRGAPYCRGQVKIDFLSADAGSYLDAYVEMTTGETSLDSADAGSATSTMVISGFANNPYLDDAGSKAAGTMRAFVFRVIGRRADGGWWDGASAEPEGCSLGLYWCTVWECDTDAGTQAGPAW